MAIFTVSKARANLHDLVVQVNMTHKETLIIGKHHNAVLVSEKEWRTIQDSLCQLSTPETNEPIREGAVIPLLETD